MKLNCDITIPAENKSTQEFRPEVPFTNSNTKNGLNSSNDIPKDIENESKGASQSEECSNCYKNDKISKPTQIHQSANIIKDLDTVNTDSNIVERKINNNVNSASKNPFSNKTDSDIVRPIETDAQEKNNDKEYFRKKDLPSCVEKYSMHTIEIEDEENETTKVMIEHEHAAFVNNLHVETVETTVNVISSSTDNNPAEEFAFEVPLTNINAETQQTCSNILALNDVINEVKENEPDSSNNCITSKSSGAIECENTKLHSSDNENTVEIEIGAYSNNKINEPDNASDKTIARKKRRYEKKSALNYMEHVKTIVLDDDDPIKGDSEIIDLDVKDNDCDIVEATTSKCERQIQLNNERNINFTNVKQSNQYDEIYQSNTEMAELIEMCLNMQNTDGMTRVIYKTLIPIFNATETTFKKSDELKRVLRKTMMFLERQPLKKFSHIKNLCDILKTHKAKKRVPFITLEENERSKGNGTSSNVPAKRRKVEAIIELDDDNNDTNGVTVQNNQTQNITVHNKPIKEYPPIEIDDDDDSDSDLLVENGSVSIDCDVTHDDDVIILDEKTKSKKKRRKKNATKFTTKKFTKYKDNHRIWRENQRKKQNKILHINAVNNLRKKLFNLRTNSSNPNRVTGVSVKCISNANGMSIRQSSDEVPDIADPGELLLPRMEKVVSMAELSSEKIRSIEAQIAQLKARLDMFEEMEVTSDTGFSPYLVSEQLKASIVRLYKELCKLTGTVDVKRHEVRLQVIPGHPEGPVRCFEEFLNENIDEEGNPPFPDIQDVIECVCTANSRYAMNLTRSQVMSEAHALFTQFGREMQKRRQRREWRDLMSLVKKEVVDPADEDPGLQARLAANSAIAKKNEDELLDRFAKMEQGIQNFPGPRMNIEQSGSEDSDTDVDVETVENNETYAINRLHSISTISVLEGNILLAPTNSSPIINPGLVNEAATTLNPQAPIFGSTVSISGGNIIIEPTVNTTPNTVVLEPNMTGMNAQSKNMSKLDLVEDCTKRTAVVAINRNEYSSAFQNYLVERQNNLRRNRERVIEYQTNKIESKLKLQKRKTSDDAVNCINTDLACAYPKASSHNSTKNTASNCAPIDNLESAAKLAREILSLVQSDLQTTNSNEKSTNNFEHGQDDGFEIYTHTNTWKPAHMETHTTGEEFNKHKEVDSHSVENIANAPVAEVSNAVLQVENAASQNDVENKDDIVKSEPLDIPSMLEELGNDFSATIFDIEGADAFRDPFLVIDISDSSDSEDEENI